MNSSSSSSVPTRTGKIARLPQHLREELNHRLEQNVPARLLIAWLNDLPEVKTLLRLHFRSAPINAQNISNWRRHGFAEWQARQSFLSGLRDIAGDAADIASALGSISDHAARLLALHFTRILCPSETIRGQEPQSPGLPDTTIKLLCQMSHALSALRRGDHARARLQQQKKSPPAQPEIKPNQASSSPRTPSVPSVPSVPFSSSLPPHKSPLFGTPVGVPPSGGISCLAPRLLPSHAPMGSSTHACNFPQTPPNGCGTRHLNGHPPAGRNHTPTLSHP